MIIQLIEDYAPVIEVLRGDLVNNNCVLDALEHNVPPVPRRVYAAYAQGELRGLMVVEQFPTWWVADLRASVNRPESLPLLLRELNAEQEYRISWASSSGLDPRPFLLDLGPLFDIRAYIKEDLPPRLLHSDQVRKLSSADSALTDEFPAPRPNLPSLTQLVNWAEEGVGPPAIVYGLVHQGRVATFVHFQRVTANIWEADIATREDSRRQGLGKAALAGATRQLVEQGILSLYQVQAAHTASVRTVESAGYREAFRVYGCDAKVNGCRLGE